MSNYYIAAFWHETTGTDHAIAFSASKAQIETYLMSLPDRDDGYYYWQNAEAFCQSTEQPEAFDFMTLEEV